MTNSNRFNNNQSWNGMIKWGGLSLFLAGIIVIIFVAGVGLFKITLPLDPLTTLQNPSVSTALFIITLVGEFLLFPGFLALYFALRDDDKIKMLMAIAISAFSVVMFFVSRGLIFTMSKVHTNYTEAATDSSTYVITAEFALKAQDVYSTMALILLSIASIFVGLVMLKSKSFSRIIGYIVILSGIFSIITPFAVNLGIPLAISLIGLFLMLVWQIGVGLKLFTLGNNS